MLEYKNSVSVPQFPSSAILTFKSCEIKANFSSVHNLLFFSACFFNAIVLTDRYGKDYWKPSRKPFDILSNKFGIKLNDMYYVGDNPAKDFYLSIYGINTVRFYNPNGVHFAEKYKDNIVEKYRIDKISGIIELLD